MSASLKSGAHHCEACGSKARVTAMSHWEGETRRQLECACGERWLSIETRGKRLQPAGTGSNGLEPVGTGGKRLEPVDQNRPPAVAYPPATERRGVGGVLPSDQIPVRSSDPDPSLLVIPAQTQTRARERRRSRTEPPAYPSEFEREWEATAKTGSKLRAFEAWERMGRPQLAGSWSRWSRTDSWQRGFVPHVATWLNDRRWEQEPVEVVRAPAPTKASRSVDVARDWVPPEQRRAG